MKNKNIISSFARFNCKVQYRQIQDLGSILFNQPTFLENPNLFRQLESKKNKQKMSFNTNIVCTAKIISDTLEGTVMLYLVIGLIRSNKSMNVNFLLKVHKTFKI